MEWAKLESTAQAGGIMSPVSLVFHTKATAIIWDDKKWVDVEFQNEVKTLIYFIKENKNRLASGAVH